MCKMLACFSTFTFLWYCLITVFFSMNILFPVVQIIKISSTLLCYNHQSFFPARLNLKQNIWTLSLLIMWWPKLFFHTFILWWVMLFSPMHPFMPYYVAFHKTYNLDIRSGIRWRCGDHKWCNLGTELRLDSWSSNPEWILGPDFILFDELDMP